MSAGDWDYQAGRLNGDGTIDIIETELPLKVTSLARNLSAPCQVNGSIDEPLARLKNNGKPVFDPWNTVILAVASDQIRAMAIYRKPTFTGESWSLDTIGPTGYLEGMPYDGIASYVETDPALIYRDIWEHVQTRPGGNLGITLDVIDTPIRVGKNPTGDNTDGPRQLNWWSTHNLADVVDSLASETPFDTEERFTWDGDQPHCHIAMGYPKIGGQANGLSFVYGVNLATDPTGTTDPIYNEAWALGAGEGRDSIRGQAGISDGKLRRIKIVKDPSKTDTDGANALARKTLAASRGEIIVSELTVFDHSNAPLDAVELGMEIPLHLETPWIELHTSVRVIGRTDDPVKSDQATFLVIQERVT